MFLWTLTWYYMYRQFAHATRCNLWISRESSSVCLTSWLRVTVLYCPNCLCRCFRRFVPVMCLLKVHLVRQCVGLSVGECISLCVSRFVCSEPRLVTKWRLENQISQRLCTVPVRKWLSACHAYFLLKKHFITNGHFCLFCMSLFIPVLFPCFFSDLIWSRSRMLSLTSDLVTELSSGSLVRILRLNMSSAGVIR